MEIDIVHDILENVGAMDNVRIFRNNVGVAFQGEGKPVYTESRIGRRLCRRVTLLFFRVIRFGLLPGSGDLIGWKSVVITPEMVGQRFARFVSIEVKRPRQKPSWRQRAWRNVLSEMGGLAGIATSVEEARKIIN